ncbi:MAG: response regulator [Candidatus Thiodiazotropha sp. (ex Monitilora ramsayi)]|nr:response regulator [Candidatus Thiodiazotropha sp. (ex Monitilora ramsayi)]
MDDLFGRLRYLIIDDFEQMRVSFKGMLTGFGALDIETCACGEMGLKALSVHNYDVVICDYNLGDGKDGQQVLEEARHLGYLRHACSFFMITAESNMPMVLGALEQQPDEYMVKPINSDVLQHRLVSVLKRKHQLKAIDQALADGDKLGAISLCGTQRDGDLKKRLYLAKLQSELCIDLERYDDAESIYRQMLKIRDFPWANFGLGKIDFFRGDLERASGRFRALIDKNPHYLEVYDWLARVLAEQGEERDAQALLQQAVKLSPKLVSRQRHLGELALENGEMALAERAYYAAVRWGENSCFAKAEEYRQLARLYQDDGNTPKLLRLLTDGRKRFADRPSDQIQLLSRQALARRHVDENEPIDTYLQEIDHLVAIHKGALAAEDLMAAADDLFRLSCCGEAEMLLHVLLCNHHDEDEWIERVRELMQKYRRVREADALIDESRGELKRIHTECVALLQQGGVERAISLLNQAVDHYPSNRTIILMSVSAMIDYMREHGVEPGYHFRCRYSLNRLLERDRRDLKADRFLHQLTQLSTRPEQEYSVAG